MPRNKKPDAVSYVFRVQWLFIDVNYENLESKPIWPTNGKYQQVSEEYEAYEVPHWLTNLPATFS